MLLRSLLRDLENNISSQSKPQHLMRISITLWGPPCPWPRLRRPGSEARQLCSVHLNPTDGRLVWAGRLSGWQAGCQLPRLGFQTPSRHLATPAPLGSGAKSKTATCCLPPQKLISQFKTRRNCWRCTHHCIGPPCTVDQSLIGFRVSRHLAPSKPSNSTNLLSWPFLDLLLQASTKTNFVCFVLICYWHSAEPNDNVDFFFTRVTYL